MATREEVIDRWQQRLAQADDADATATRHMRWMRRVYARVYRFLLACYGNDAWRTQPVEERPLAVEDPLYVATAEDVAGKPAKRPGEIGKVLKSVHAANRGVTRGHTTSSMFKRTWIRAAEFKVRPLAKRYRYLLKQQRIEARIVRRASRFFVEVRHADFDAAMDLFSDHRTDLCHATYRKRRHPYVMTLADTAKVLLWLLAGLFPALLGLFILQTFDAVYPPFVLIAAVLYFAWASVMIYLSQRSQQR